MSVRRFFVPPAQIREGIAVLPSGSAHHLREVLRLDAGARVEVFDGEGHAWRGRVEVAGDEVHVALEEPVPIHADSEPRIILGLALIRPERFEWAIEKSTELGVAEVVPLQARYSTVRIAGAKLPDRLERWERIAREASRQCERATVPVIRPPMTPEDLFQLPEIAGSRKLWFHERTGERPSSLRDAKAPVLICIGPEGGWHPDETESARTAGCSIVTLGKRVLRTETAAVAALAVLQCWRESERAPEE